LCCFWLSKEKSTRELIIIIASSIAQIYIKITKGKSRELKKLHASSSLNGSIASIIKGISAVLIRIIRSI
jgi:hypothetical protein